MALSKKVKTALKDANAVLIRSTKHEVWRFPNGRIVTISTTNSDNRAERNQLADIRKAIK